MSQKLESRLVFMIETVYEKLSILAFFCYCL